MTLRRELENYLSKQLQVKGSNANKNTGRSLSVILEKAKDMKSTLDDSFVSTEALLLSVAKNDDKFTKEALERQDVSYDKVLDAGEWIQAAQYIHVKLLHFHFCAFLLTCIRFL